MDKNSNTIGDYHLLHPLGRGGMAEVFAVEKTGPGGFQKQLCLKRIRPELAKDQSFIASFESEAKIVAKLAHPNIVQVFDFFRDGDDLCMVMELVDGLDLHRIMRMMYSQGSQFPIPAAVFIMESLLKALQYAHHLDSNGEQLCVIHRDISPQNLLISILGTVKLADFGVAKARGVSPDTTDCCLKGKLSYMAPERLKLGKVPVGPQSDLFSAGIVFWEMLATRRMFLAATEQAVLSKVINFEKAPIDYLRQEMNQFLEKILAPAPENRFHSAYEALMALRDVGVAPCSQEEMARLVQKARDFEHCQTMAQNRAIATLPNGDAVSATALEKTHHRGTLRFGVAVLIGVVAVLLVAGAFAVWRGMNHNSNNGTIHNAVQIEAPNVVVKKASTKPVELDLVTPDGGEDMLVLPKQPHSDRVSVSETNRDTQKKSPVQTIVSETTLLGLTNPSKTNYSKKKRRKLRNKSPRTESALKDYEPFGLEQEE